jgi:hypothetical protein
MKTKIITIVTAAVILLGVSEALATSIAFYEDGVIQEGDVYAYVSVFNNATVDMTGGIVTEIFTAYDFSTVNVSGGVLNILDSWDSATLNLSGDVQVDELGVVFSGTANISGGNIGLMEVGSSNPVNLHGGVISDYLKAVSTVNIYGYGFEYNPLAGDYRGGQLTGFWLDDTPFSIDLYYDDTPGGPFIDTYSHIVLIPEPATILLIGLGAFNIRISKFRKGEKS